MRIIIKGLSTNYEKKKDGNEIKKKSIGKCSTLFVFVLFDRWSMEECRG
jgi:hypothetical protein